MWNCSSLFRNVENVNILLYCEPVFLFKDPFSSSSSVHFQMPKNLQSLKDFRPNFAKIFWENLTIYLKKLFEKVKKKVKKKFWINEDSSYLSSVHFQKLKNLHIRLQYIFILRCNTAVNIHRCCFVPWTITRHCTVKYWVYQW